MKETKLEERTMRAMNGLEIISARQLGGEWALLGEVKCRVRCRGKIAQR